MTKNKSSHPFPSSSQQPIVQNHVVMRSAPIPAPSELADYEKIKTGFAERILAMAENQSGHRQELEQKKLEAEIKQPQ